MSQISVSGSNRRFTLHVQPEHICQPSLILILNTDPTRDRQTVRTLSTPPTGQCHSCHSPQTIYHPTPLHIEHPSTDKMLPTTLLYLLVTLLPLTLAVPFHSLPIVVIPPVDTIDPVGDALTPAIEARIQQLAADLPLAQKARLLDMYQGQEILDNGILNTTRVKELSGGLGFGSIHDFYPPTADYMNTIQAIVLNDTADHIPVFFIEECLHGMLQPGHSSFPAPLGLAASFNPTLIERMAAVLGKEMRAYGVRMCLAPVLGAAREPRWGRSEETFGEDTYLIKTYARHFVWGMQGRQLSNATVVSEPKHYAAHSIPEGGRNTAVSHVGPREMLDTFLPQFESAVRAGALSMMSAYSEYDGVPCSASQYLLTQKLRTDWGFKGFVLSDLGAVQELATRHFIAGSPQSAIEQFLIAGGNSQFYDYDHDTYQQAIIDGVNSGTLPMDVLNQRVADVLRIRELLKINEQPYTDTSLVYTDINTDEARQLALLLAKQSIVLLKNNNVTGTAQPLLPLARQVASGAIKSIAVVGILADYMNVADYAGPFNQVNDLQNKNMLQALTERSVNDSTTISWSPGVYTVDVPDIIPIPKNHYVSRGWNVSFYTSTDLSGGVALQRYDPQMSYSFAKYGFDRQYPSCLFSGRWEGSLTWPFTVTGSLSIASDQYGGVRMWIDGKQVVDQWGKVGGCQPCLLPYKFVKGETHDFVIEYWQNGPEQTLVLGWDLITPDYEAAIARSVADAQAADAVIVAVGDNGRTSGEGTDRTSLDLSGHQLQLVDAIAALNKPTVVVLFSGRAPSIPTIAANPAIPALIEAYSPGQAQGDALMAVLYGDYNPAGRLPLTYPMTVGQAPFFYNHKGSAWGGYVDLSPSQPVFPFGHGLSYTHFSYSDLVISPRRVAADGTVKVQFTVTNDGGMDGEEVSQLYLTDVVSSTTTPLKQLRGFARYHVPAGQATHVQLTLNVSVDCALVDHELQWVVEPGLFNVVIGVDSSDAGARLYGNFSVVSGVGAGWEDAEDGERTRLRQKELNEQMERDRLARLQAKRSVQVEDEAKVQVVAAADE